MNEYYKLQRVQNSSPIQAMLVQHANLRNWHHKYNLT
jgi:hypothetical protein